jgi:hypothetical protein
MASRGLRWSKAEYPTGEMRRLLAATTLKDMTGAAPISTGQLA